MSFLFGEKFGSEIALMPNVGNIVTYQETQNVLAHLYDNGINYIFHGTSEEYDEEEPSYDVLQVCWDIPKLSNTHLVTDGGDLNYGDRVFGFPMIVGNIPTLTGGASDPILEYLQFHHVLSTGIEKVSYDGGTEQAVFKIDFNASKLADLALEYSDYIGESMILSYNDSQDTEISGFDDPNNIIEIEEDCSELECTILSVYDTPPYTYVEVQINSVHDETMIDRTRYLAPNNQKIMILPLGNGFVEFDDADGIRIASDTYTANPSQEGLISWTYNLDSGTMSKALNTVSPILRFTMDNLEFYKMMIITLRNQEISKFPHGFNMKIFT